MKRSASILLAILFLTAAYVFAWPSANVPYFGAVLLHFIAGVLFLVAMIFAMRPIWQAASPASRLGWILLASGGLIGAALIFTGTRRNEWSLLYTHIGLCVAGGALLASTWAGKRGFLTGSYIAAVFRGVAFLLAAALITVVAWKVRTAPWERGHRIVNPAVAPASMDAEGYSPSGPFFPSS
jgi:hypothetical protein